MPTLEESSVSIQVQGTTVIAVYDVRDGSVLLASADFGDAQAPLNGVPHRQVAATLLRTLAEASMASSGDRFMPDDHQAHPLPLPGRKL